MASDDESSADNQGSSQPITNGHAPVDELHGSSSEWSTLGLPSAILIVTNVPEIVFIEEKVKSEFEALFQRYDVETQFYYLRSFRRARVVLQSVPAATLAHTSLHRHEFLGVEVKCYYAQPPIETRDPSNKYLEPPEPEKQFLISPPASPPVGWEVITEREPFVNYDLINAIAQMGPGDSYELFHGTEDQPSIVVHVCEDPEGYDKRPTKIEQTRCPDRKPQ